MNKHKSNKIKENSNTVRHFIMGQITTTQNVVAIKEVRHAGQWTNVDISLVRFCGIRLISLSVPTLLFRTMSLKIILSKLLPHLAESNEFSVRKMCWILSPYRAEFISVNLRTYVYFLYHFSSVWWRSFWETFLVEARNKFILHWKDMGKDSNDLFIPIPRNGRIANIDIYLLHNESTRNWLFYSSLLLFTHTFKHRCRHDDGIWSFAGARVVFKSTFGSTPDEIFVKKATFLFHYISHTKQSKTKL